MDEKQIQSDVTAQWAREISKSVMSEKSKGQLNDILTVIKNAVSRNEMQTTALSIDDLVKKELERRGFSCQYHNVSSIDPRESSYWSIKW